MFCFLFFRHRDTYNGNKCRSIGVSTMLFSFPVGREGEWGKNEPSVLLSQQVGSGGNRNRSPEGNGVGERRRSFPVMEGIAHFSQMAVGKGEGGGVAVTLGKSHQSSWQESGAAKCAVAGAVLYSFAQSSAARKCMAHGGNFCMEPAKKMNTGGALA